MKKVTRNRRRKKGKGKLVCNFQPSVLQQPGVAIPTTLTTSQVPTLTVSYPTPRAIQQTQGQTIPPAQQQPKQRVFTGNVTKIHDDFGFVDGDVFFQMRLDEQ